GNVEAGRYKAYAVMSEKRWSKSPNTPTMIESGVPGLSISLLARLVYDKGGTQLRRRSVGGRRQGCLCRPGPAAAARNARPSHISARSAEPRSTRGVPNGGDRQMVADHQSSKHQGRISAWVNVRFGSEADIRRRMSALPPKADIETQSRNVRFVRGQFEEINRRS